MDLDQLVAAIMEDGVKEYKNFEMIKQLVDQYNQLQVDLKDYHFRLEEVSFTRSNYATMIEVEQQLQPMSELSLQLLQEKETEAYTELGEIQLLIKEALIYMEVIRTTIDYLIQEPTEDEELEEDETYYSEETEEDQAEYEAVEADDSTFRINNPVQVPEGTALLATIEFTSDIPNDVKQALGEYIQECVVILLESMTQEPETDEVNIDQPLENFFNSMDGTFSGSLEVSTPEDDTPEDGIMVGYDLDGNEELDAEIERLSVQSPVVKAINDSEEPAREWITVPEWESEEDEEAEIEGFNLY